MTTIRVILLCSFLLQIPIVSFADDNRLYVKPDNLSSERYHITDSKGNRIGTLKPDPLNSNQIQITDQNGIRSGYIRRDNTSSHSKRYRIYNQDGSFKGGISQDVLQPNDKFQIFDREGKRKGVIKKDIFGSDKWEIDIKEN